MMIPEPPFKLSAKLEKIRTSHNNAWAKFQDRREQAQAELERMAAVPLDDIKPAEHIEQRNKIKVSLMEIEQGEIALLKSIADKWPDAFKAEAQAAITQSHEAYLTLGNQLAEKMIDLGFVTPPDVEDYGGMALARSSLIDRHPAVQAAKAIPHNILAAMSSSVFIPSTSPIAAEVERRQDSLRSIITAA